MVFSEIICFDYDDNMKYKNACPKYLPRKIEILIN